MGLADAILFLQVLFALAALVVPSRCLFGFTNSRPSVEQRGQQLHEYKNSPTMISLDAFGRMVPLGSVAPPLEVSPSVIRPSTLEQSWMRIFFKCQCCDMLRHAATTAILNHCCQCFQTLNDTEMSFKQFALQYLESSSV